jgi:TolB-like protein/AraC-like DNA-binding protein/tetratricopeptide (TPR) repeat protein
MNNSSLNKLNEVVLENLSDENFGPEQLAAKMEMSHSALHRKIKNTYNKTISQLIREVRLQKAKEMLQSEELSVSEIAYKVGFGSPSYFNKCFHEFFGLSPGEYRKKEQAIAVDNHVKGQNKNKNINIVIIPALIIIGIIVTFFLLTDFFQQQKSSESEKISIGVYPFQYHGEKPEEDYLADAMMEAVMFHLSCINDLEVESRYSMELYSDLKKTIKQIGRELDIDFLLEGSFQKHGNQVKLILRLLKTEDESTVWNQEYDFNWSHVFNVQRNVSHSIAEELNAVVTPEEIMQFEKTPTFSLIAYDCFQRGREEIWKYELNNVNTDALAVAERLYYDALKYDPSFAQAYAGLARVAWYKHYRADYMMSDFLDSVLLLADKALLYDPFLSEAYYLKGEYYRLTGSRLKAEKEYSTALKINPNDWMAYLGMGYLYQYNDELKAIENFHQVVVRNNGRNLPAVLRNLSSSYLSAGFTEPALGFVKKAFELDSDSTKYFSSLGNVDYLKGDYLKALDVLNVAFRIDSTNINVLNLMGWCWTCIAEYDTALFFYNKYADKVDLSLLAPNNLHRIAYANWKNGNEEKANYFFDQQVAYSQKALEEGRFYSDYLQYDMAAVFAFRNEKEIAYEYLMDFISKKDLIPLWFSVLVKIDPLLDNLRGDPEFEQFVADVEKKYEINHLRVKKWLETHEL